MNRIARQCSVLVLLCADCAFADEALRLYQGQQHEQEQLQLEQRLRQFQRQPVAPEALPEPIATPDAACWQVTGLSIAGNQRIASPRIAAVTTPLLHPCMGTARINQLLKAITTLYLEAGYLASRPYLANPPQDGQPLEIMIIEGFVEAIEVSDPDLPLSLSSAFPGMLGEPLQLRDLEQGLDQLNRLQVFDLTADVQPGEFEGGSRLVLQPRSKPSRWKLKGSLDNDSMGYSGSHLAMLAASIDSPLHLNDFLHVAHKRTLSHVTGSNSMGRTRITNLDYALPFGRWLLSANAHQMHAFAQHELAPIAFVSTITAQTLKAERTLWRNGQGLLHGRVQWTHRKYDSEIAGLGISVHESEVNVGEAGLNLLWIEKGLWSADVAYSHGLTGSAFASDAPQPRFEKYRASLSHDRHGNTFGQGWHLNTQASLQYSPDRLPSLELKGIGGPNAVRGFNRATISSTTGGLWNSTLNLPWQLVPGLILTPHVGVDFGWARHHPNDISPHQPRQQRLIGMGTGARLRWRDVTLDLGYQRALHDSSRRPLETGIWLSELSFAL